MHALIRKLSPLILPVLLGACGLGRSLSQPYTEPTSGDTAQMRVVTNGRVRLIPEQSCVSWDNKDLGTVVSNNIHVGVTPHLNGQSLGMMPALDPALTDKGYLSAEVQVRADKPLTLYFDIEEISGSWKYWCEPIAASFIPMKGESYEAFASMDDGKCRLNVKSLSKPGKRPAQRWVERCS